MTFISVKRVLEGLNIVWPKTIVDWLYTLMTIEVKHARMVHKPFRIVTI